MHEGWNYFELVDPTTDLAPKYQYYRLVSSAANAGCTGLGEIRYFGYEVIDDTQLEYNCEIELVENANTLSPTVTDLSQ